MDEELWKTMGEKITEVKTEKSEKITNKSENHRKTSTVLGFFSIFNFHLMLIEKRGIKIGDETAQVQCDDR